MPGFNDYKNVSQGTQDHLFGLCKVYVHFVWGGPGLQLLKEGAVRSDY